MGKELETYWVISDVHFLATVLQPNLKSFNHTPHEKYRGETVLKKEFEKRMPLQPDPSSSSNNRKRKQNPSRKQQLSASLDDIFDLPSSPDKVQVNASPKTAVERYMADETRIDKDMNVLTYWSHNQSTYPVLAGIAQRVLPIPAINTSIEHLFPDSGNTMTNRRMRLQTVKVNQLLFIRRNLAAERESFPPSIGPARKRKNSSTSTTPMKIPKCSTSTVDQRDAACNEPTWIDNNESGPLADYYGEDLDDNGQEVLIR